MRLIDADVFLEYLIFSKHIDSLKCREVKEAVEMSKVDVLDKIRDEIEKTYLNITYQENKNGASWGLRKALDIIDKYKGESGDKDADSN